MTARADTLDPALGALLDALPEVYQPLFGYQQTDALAVRPIAARFAAIAQIVRAVPADRVRILDVGCAQGYFSFGLASMSAERCEVVGIDNLDLNIAVCQALATRNHISAQFEVADFGVNYATTLARNAFDVVLLLNVLHHCAERDGIAAVHRCLDLLSVAAPIVLMELALPEEPATWAQSLPDKPEAFLRSFAFVRQIGDFATHLSPIRRPLYFCSNRYAWIDRQLFEFHEHRNYPHALAPSAHEGTRHYYFSTDALIKAASVGGKLGERNRDELQRERDFLVCWRDRLPDLPRLLAFEAGAEHLYLVRESAPGRLLSETLPRLDLEVRRQIARHVLQLLVRYERLGLYHHDLRAWNVLVAGDGVPEVRLIDFGAFDSQRDPADFDAFFALVHDLMQGRLPSTLPSIPRSRRSPASFPPPWNRVVAIANSFAQEALTFDGLARLCDESACAASSATPPDPASLLFEALETRHNRTIEHFAAELDLHREALARVQAAAIAEHAQIAETERNSAQSYAALRTMFEHLKSDMAEATTYARTLEEALRQKDRYVSHLLSIRETPSSAPELVSQHTEAQAPLDAAIVYNRSLIESLDAKDAYARSLVETIGSMRALLAEARGKAEAAETTLGAQATARRTDALAVSLWHERVDETSTDVQQVASDLADMRDSVGALVETQLGIFRQLDEHEGRLDAVADKVALSSTQFRAKLADRAQRHADTEAELSRLRRSRVVRWVEWLQSNRPRGGGKTR